MGEGKGVPVGSGNIPVGEIEVPVGGNCEGVVSAILTVGAGGVSLVERGVRSVDRTVPGVIVVKAVESAPCGDAPRAQRKPRWSLLPVVRFEQRRVERMLIMES